MLGGLLPAGLGLPVSHLYMLTYPIIASRRRHVNAHEGGRTRGSKDGSTHRQPLPEAG